MRQKATIWTTKLVCPKCQSEYFTKNGSDENGEKRYVCKMCSRSYIESKAVKVLRPICYCGSTDFEKNGKPGGNQRYRCRICKSNTTQHILRSIITPELKREVLNWHKWVLSEGQSISSRALAKRYGVSATLVTQWVNEFKKETADREKVRLLRLNGRPDKK